MVILFLVVKLTGLCLYLSKESLKLEAHDCKEVFKSGCPEIPYMGSTIYKCKALYCSSCIHIFALLHQLNSYNTRDSFYEKISDFFSIYKVVFAVFLAYFLWLSNADNHDENFIKSPSILPKRWSDGFFSYILLKWEKSISINVLNLKVNQVKLFNCFTIC